MPRIPLLAMFLAVLAAAALVSSRAASSSDGSTQWRVTIENLTPAPAGAPGSQPLSPPLFVVHSNKTDVWSIGEAASPGVAAIAEDADTAPLTAALSGAPGVAGVSTGAGGPIASGTSRSYVVETTGRFNRLSVLTMLVNTNDGFTGLDALHLHGQGTSLETMAYDAGSEMNNERAAFIPGPCCGHPFVRAPENGVIAMHRGIAGVGDLDPALYGWSGAVARITIERL
jgi:Spondin_N